MTFLCLKSLISRRKRRLEELLHTVFGHMYIFLTNNKFDKELRITKIQKILKGCKRKHSCHLHPIKNILKNSDFHSGISVSLPQNSTDYVQLSKSLKAYGNPNHHANNLSNLACASGSPNMYMKNNICFG